MQPGPDYIYQCPTCDNLLFKGSLVSGNTIGAKAFSDGKMEAPMLPEFPDLTKCSKCDSIFWLNEAHEVGKNYAEIYSGLDYEQPDERFNKAEKANFLSLNEYFTAIERKIYSTVEEELLIRKRIWWSFNDRVRNGKELFTSTEDKKLWKDNIYRLIYILDVNDVSQKIMIAELYRNLGEFNKCTEILDATTILDGKENLQLIMEKIYSQAKVQAIRFLMSTKLQLSKNLNAINVVMVLFFLI